MRISDTETLQWSLANKVAYKLKSDAPKMTNQT